MKTAFLNVIIFCLLVFSFAVQAEESLGSTNNIEVKESMTLNEDECFTRDGMNESRSYISSSFQWENDIGNSDRWYTNGMKYTRTIDPNSKCNSGYPYVDKVARRFLRFNDDEPPRNAIALTSWVAGMNMYTPKVITEPGPQANDRPWTGWAYLGRNWQVNYIASGQQITDKEGNKSNLYASDGSQKLEVLLGVLGGKANQDRVQRAWHTLVNAQYPAGWENQDGGKLGYSVAYTRYWNEPNFEPFDSANYGRALLNYRVGAIAGNVVQQVSAGGSVILDFSPFSLDDNSYFPVASLQFLPQIAPVFQMKSMTQSHTNAGTKVPIKSGDKLKDARLKWYKHRGFSVFADFEVRVLRSSYFLQSTSVELKHFVGDAKIGLAYKFKNSDCTFRYSYVVRSPEFSVPGGGNANAQRFSQFSWEWNWGFVKNPLTNLNPSNSQ